MAARINHITTMSTNPMAIGTMYETIFGLNFDTSPKPANYGEVLTDHITMFSPIKKGTNGCGNNAATFGGQSN